MTKIFASIDVGTSKITTIVANIGEEDLEAIDLNRYKDVPSKEKKAYSRDKIAVIYAMGTVVDGNMGEGYIGSERISRAIRKARRDKSVKAIVFRVNSGGGGVVAAGSVSRAAGRAWDVASVWICGGESNNL